MSFLLHRVARGRPFRVTSSFVKGSRWKFLLPTNAADLGARIGTEEPSFFWTSDNQKGYWANSTGGEVLLSPTGKPSDSGYVKLIDTSGSGSTRQIVTSQAFLNNTSLAVIAIASFVGDASSSVAEIATGAVPSYGLRLVPFGHVDYCVFYAQNDGESFYYADGPVFTRSGAPFVIIFGWDARTKKAWSVKAGSKTLAYGAQSAGLWAALGPLALRYANLNPALSLMMLSQFIGTSAEYIADNAVSTTTKASGFLTSIPSVSSSNSIGIIDNYVNLANNPQISSSGLVINKSVTNLMAHSYSMAAWTASNLTVGKWSAISTTGNRSLSQLTETTANAVHKASIVVNPVSAGFHYVQFDVKFGYGLEQVCCEISNGTDQEAMSLDLTGAQTPFATSPNATITTLDFRLYRVSWKVELTVTDALTVAFGGLEPVTYNDEYVGVATRSVMVGNWCITYNEVEGVCPVSLGTPATAIAPIVDWSLESALRRLASGRLTCDLTVHMGAWPEEDVILWTWRKDANNGFEVWLRYQGTLDKCRRFIPAINIITGGSGTETALTSLSTWVLQNDSGTPTRVETLRMSVSIDSSGVAKWWVRSEAGQEIEIYEDPIATSGEDTLGSYASQVPTSLRLGSSVAGTGQQSMTVKEVSVW